MSFSPSSLPASLQHDSGILETFSGPVERSRASERTWVDLIQHAGKRAVDVIGSSLGLLLLSPIMLVIALLIRLGSRGPALFRQTRLGKDGRPFRMYKFRTMVVDAEARLEELEPLNESQGGVLFKMKRDPRVTRFGRILRRTNLDELPQLFNILKGEMSLVGPRPLQLRDCALLARAEPEGFVRRLGVPPGLTGPWQVSDRSETDYVHMMGLELDYLDRWSLWFDLWLTVQTIALVITGRPICRRRPLPGDCSPCTVDSRGLEPTTRHAVVEGR